MPLTSQELQSQLWQAADVLRGQIDSSDYKNYIFSILVLKQLADRFDEEVPPPSLPAFPPRLLFPIPTGTSLPFRSRPTGTR